MKKPQLLLLEIFLRSPLHSLSDVVPRTEAAALLRHYRREHRADFRGHRTAPL